MPSTDPVWPPARDRSDSSTDSSSGGTGAVARIRWPSLGDCSSIRQRNAAIELARKDDYDYVVVNEEGRVDHTAKRIEEIIEQEERRGSRRAVTV